MYINIVVWRYLYLEECEYGDRASLWRSSQVVPLLKYPLVCVSQIKGNELDGTCRRRGRNDKNLLNLGRKTQRKMPLTKNRRTRLKSIPVQKREREKYEDLKRCIY
jgi:hypothetical protein